MSGDTDSVGEETPAQIRAGEELVQKFQAIARAIDNLLVAHHGLRASLPDPHPPMEVSIGTALTFYGDRQALFHLWNECRLVAELRAVWTGKP